jgi:hypothetical protein
MGKTKKQSKKNHRGARKHRSPLSSSPEMPRGRASRREAVLSVMGRDAEYDSDAFADDEMNQSILKTVGRRREPVARTQKILRRARHLHEPPYMSSSDDSSSSSNYLTNSRKPRHVSRPLRNYVRPPNTEDDIVRNRVFYLKTERDRLIKRLTDPDRHPLVSMPEYERKLLEIKNELKNPKQYLIQTKLDQLKRMLIAEKQKLDNRPPHPETRAKQTQVNTELEKLEKLQRLFQISDMSVEISNYL